MDLNTFSLELDLQMFLRLLIAVVLGALVGYERERAGKPAGVRTHGMVSLGAGAILHRRGYVEGLTTAASLWVTAAIGLAVGVGMLFMSVATAILVFLLLHFGPRPRPKAVNDESE